MYSEEDFLPISRIQHFLFCERRAALVHIEGIWEDNLFTVEGSHLHKKVDDEIPTESRNDIRISRGLLLRSLELGLSGKTDVVEFHRISDEKIISSVTAEERASAITLEGTGGLWRPYPVEYKRGRMRHEEGFEAQLCAQAICLEEMLGCSVPEGAIYYGKPHRRLVVVFDSALREKTFEASRHLHTLVASGHTPQARYEKKCDSCSLFSACMPKVTGTRRSVQGYIAKVLDQEP